MLALVCFSSNDHGLSRVEVFVEVFIHQIRHETVRHDKTLETRKVTEAIVSLTKILNRMTVEENGDNWPQAIS